MRLQGAVPVYPLGTRKNTDRLDITRFYVYKPRSSSAMRACGSSAPTIRNELILAQKRAFNSDFTPALFSFNLRLMKHKSLAIERNGRPGKREGGRDFWHMTATAGSDVVQSGRPIFDDFFQHLWPYIGNNTANVVFQMVKRLWLIRIDQ
ncbi:adhesion G protein-coupled receptor B2 [Trichonephila clavipes]|nr:adhesion G protein-coupled receptor B2 [Trichonephila clavipes]